MMVGEQYERTGQIPPNLDQFIGAAQSSKFVADMSIRPENGVIDLKVSFGVYSGGGTIFLIPSTAEGGKVTWSCKAEPAMNRFVPQSCRGE